MLDSYSCTIIIFQVIFYLCLSLSFRVNRLAGLVYGLLYCLPCFMEPLSVNSAPNACVRHGRLWFGLVFLITSSSFGIYLMESSVLKGMITDGESLTGWMPFASLPWIFDCVLIDVCLI